MGDLPTSGYATGDLLKSAEMLARAIARGRLGLNSWDVPIVEPDPLTGRPRVSVVIRPAGRPPLRITFEEVP